MLCKHCSKETDKEFCPDCQEARELAGKLLKLTSKTIGYLYSRWQDEHEYEDINDYQLPLREQFDEVGAADVKMTKRPFGFKCIIKGVRFQYHVKRWKYSYSRIVTHVTARR